MLTRLFIPLYLLKPYYIDSLNGYVTYKMDTPKAVSGKIFLGWSQTDTRNLQIGFDRNSKKGRKHMYVFTNGTWKKSTLSTEGSPMLRLVMGHYYGNTTAISNIEKNQQIDCYPNPVKNTIFIKTDIQAPMNYQLQAITGAVLQAGTVANQQIDISAIANGIYLLSLTHRW